MATSPCYHATIMPVMLYRRGLVLNLLGLRCQFRGDWSQRMAGFSSESDYTIAGEEQRDFSYYFFSLTTMAPNGSEFSHSVWIWIFTFYFLALSLRNFSGSHHIVLSYVDMNLLRYTKSRSSWKQIAGVISQWFWCRYFAHNFILHSTCSKKKFGLLTLY